MRIRMRNAGWRVQAGAAAAVWAAAAACATGWNSPWLRNDAWVTAEARDLPWLSKPAAHNEIVAAVRRVEPAVFAVVNYASVRDEYTQEAKWEPSGVGSGVLFAKDRAAAYVVTNAHVVAGAERVQVVLPSGRHIPAQLRGSDPYTDLAVLAIPAAAVAHVTPPVFADSNTIQVGEPAVAIGTPMGLDFADTVTAGIVSAKQRMMPVEQEQTDQVLDYQPVIQTDAAINPGNSGGPLINVRGEVIGINSSKIVAPHFEGMGFAIPANAVKGIADQIIRTGHATHPALGIAGVSLASLPEEVWPEVPVDYGVLVRKVTATEARRAGLQAGDVIVGIGEKTVKTMADLRTALFEHRPGEQVVLRVYRDGRPVQVAVRLTEMTAEAMAGHERDGTWDADDGDGAGGGREDHGHALPFITPGFPR
ncbi:serine protease [Alicyclobacillus cellulosilyticus]|uniref:Serine protease n=1 Tax=Alicyclobacillus cellulosilyticus TaxID=1003997 RepID=A0A917NF94_9BACL|nr:trypsin-like peptidase domain-containing protein [Alicyclobacillus cellulosilyticus]GGI95252.1 serine protease [Alicyclobacillus cellulosilyticus]